MPQVTPFLRAVAAGTVVASLWGCAVPTDGDGAPAPRATADAPTTPGPAEESQPGLPTSPGPDTALGALSTLRVRGRAAMTGYSREAFGPGWLDANRNGCDERNDTLTRDLQDRTEKNCRVLTGTLLDPYTAREISYAYGDGTLIDIDHVVSLGNAWVSGAAAWPIRRRAALATDPLNLLAVDASANRQKGDGDAATWLPPHKAFRCSYVARQVAVKAKFGLSVTAAERDAITRVLRACPDEAVPADSGAPLEVSNNITEPDPLPPDPGSGSSYDSCDAARAAGAAPLQQGDPGYSASLDGDGDGSACE